MSANHCLGGCRAGRAPVCGRGDGRHATVTTAAQSVDTYAAEVAAWALVSQGTLDVSTVSHVPAPWFIPLNGGEYADRFPGAILPLGPAYMVAHLLGLSTLSVIPGALTAALSSAAAVVVMRRVLDSVLDVAELGTSTLFFAFGTGVWSVCANAPWSHTFSLLALVLALRYLSTNNLLLSGLALGAGVAARPTVAVAAAVLGAHLGLVRRRAGVTATIAAGTLPGVALLVVYNGLVFGSWGPSNGYEVRYEGGDVSDLSVKWSSIPGNFVGALFSPERGLVVYYPVVVFGLLVLGSAWRQASDWERGSALAGAAVAVVQLSLNRYSGGDTFWGPRLMIEPLVLATPLLARSISLYARRRSLAVVLVCLGMGVVIHAVGAVQRY